MNWNRLSSQLRREIKANPGKALLLAGLLGVALYYWIPLVGKWLGHAKDRDLVRSQATTETGLGAGREKILPASRGPTLSSGSAAPLSRGGQGSAKGQGLPSWDQLVQWRQTDLRTQPVSWSGNRPDPFQAVPITALSEGKQSSASPKAQTARKTKSASPSEPPFVQEPPERVEVELTSIVVGPTRRVALINGRPYQEGSTLIVTKDGGQWEFRLTRILPTGIYLQWNDRRYEVALPRSPSNVEIQMVSTSQTETP